MGIKFNPTHLIAIILAVSVVALVLFMLVKIASKRIVNGRRVYKSRQKTWQKNMKFQAVLLPEFPYGTPSEAFIQPVKFSQIPTLIEDDELPSECGLYYAGTLYVNLRYDLTRSILVVALLKAKNLPANKANEVNYYVIVNLFPQKHKPGQSAVNRTSSPEFNELFEFSIPLQYLLLQTLKFSVWSFDRFSHHEIIADTLVCIRELETYGLSICRDVCLARTLKLVPKVSDVCGEIFFSLGYLRLAQRLAVVIIKVTNLAKINEECPDPLVEVSLLRQDKRIKVERTSTKRSEQNPKYNETLTFDVPAEHLHESSLLFCVLSKSKESYLPEELGKVLLGPDGSGESFEHWEEMRTGTKPKARWHKLRKHF